jgi:hypothetical protein
VTVQAAAWLHLQIVYDVLLTFVTVVDVRTLRNHVSRAFLPLLASKDPRERDKLYAELTCNRRAWPPQVYI